MIEEKIAMPKKFSTAGCKFEINPLQDFLIKKQMATSEAFARAYHTDMSRVFFEYLDYKIKNKENVAIGIKGHTRSGKSLAGHSINWQIANLASNYNGGKESEYYNINNVCATESEYAYKVKEATLNQIFQVDEQRESKFQMGSVREELYIMDVQNIIAKACLSGNMFVKVWSDGKLADTRMRDLHTFRFIQLPSLNLKTMKIEKDSAKFFDMGTKQTFRVATKEGSSIEATDNHAFFVLEDGKIKQRLLKDLKVGDKLVKYERN